MPEIAANPPKERSPPLTRRGIFETAAIVAPIFAAIPGTSLVKSSKSFPLKPISSNNMSLVVLSGPGTLIINPNFEGL